jgi:heptosyltransferase-2
MRILLVPKSYLGDTVLSTPVIAGIKHIHPEAQVWMLTNPHAAQIVERDPLLSGIIHYDKRGVDRGMIGFIRTAAKLRALEINRVYSIHRSYRTAMLLWLSGIKARVGYASAHLSGLYTLTVGYDASVHEVERNLSLLAIDGDIRATDTHLRLFAPQRNALDNEVAAVLPRPGTYAVLVPGSNWRTKMWPQEGFRAVAQHLINRGMPVVLDGAPPHKPLTDKIGKNLDIINLAGKSSVADAMTIIKDSRLVVCNDSAALHVASAFKVPTVAIFCATSPEGGFSPWRNNSAIVVQNRSLTCRPCGRHGGHRCPEGTDACRHTISSKMVIEAISKALER